MTESHKQNNAKKLEKVDDIPFKKDENVDKENIK